MAKSECFICNNKYFNPIFTFYGIYRCAVGDYSGRFGKLDGSGRQYIVMDLIGLYVIVSGGNKTACGKIVPEYGEYVTFSYCMSKKQSNTLHTYSYIYTQNVRLET